MGKGFDVTADGKKFSVVNTANGSVRGPFDSLTEARDCVRSLPDAARDPGPAKPKRTRTEKGRLKADDPSTPDVNEAWEGGKAPKKKAKRKVAKKKPSKKKK